MDFSELNLNNNLILAMNDPACVLHSDQFIVIIADKYPKAEHHYLVMPREDIGNVRNLKERHVPKLVYMELKGLEFAVHASGLPVQNFQ